MSRRPRILHLDTGRELRGGQRQLAILAAGLDAEGCEQTVVLPTRAPLAARLPDSPRLRVLELPLRGELSPAALGGLRAVLKGGGFDLVHAHTAHAVTPGHLARLGLGTPLAAHRRVDFPLRRHPLARLKRGWPDLWIAVSQG
ncbi:MAG: glycosyltransferase, partial [Candidatus Krumholzibacteriota bacterium]|nr:glycosyltransferase [Candidatus Krumholzibacteriota bacterium]